MYKRCRLEEPQRLPLFIQDEFSVEVCCGIIRALQSFQTQVENFSLETSFNDRTYLNQMGSVKVHRHQNQVDRLLPLLLELEAF